VSGSAIKAVFGGALAASMLAAAPASAQSSALLDCAVNRLDSSYRASIAEAAKAGALEGKTGRLGDAVTACARAYDLSFDQQAAYYQYSLARVERDEFARQLSGVGIPTQVIDDSLGFGPFRANPLIEGNISEDQINTFYRALRDSGVDVNAVAGPTWGVIGVYVQASSTMWNAWEKLP
jgi:hypothetical protein